MLLLSLLLLLMLFVVDDDGEIVIGPVWTKKLDMSWQYFNINSHYQSQNSSIPFCLLHFIIMEWYIFNLESLLRSSMTQKLYNGREVTLLISVVSVLAML